MDDIMNFLHEENNCEKNQLDEIDILKIVNRKYSKKIINGRNDPLYKI